MLIFVNLIPGLPNLTVIRTTRMLKPLRSISRFPTLKTIVSTMVRSAQDICDVYIICLFVFMVFGVVCMDLFGGALAQRCVNPVYACDVLIGGTNLTSYEDCSNAGGVPSLAFVERQPDALTFPIVDRTCGVYQCEPGYQCMLGNLDMVNPGGGALAFDNLGYSMLTVFVVITRRGWTDILHKLYDSFGYVAPTGILLLLQMFGSYLLTQMVTAAITFTVRFNFTFAMCFLILEI